MKVIITVERPNKEIEKVDVSSKFPVGLTDQLFEAVKKGTKEAGKGTCLSYENIQPTKEEVEESYAKLLGITVEELRAQERLEENMRRAGFGY